MGFFIDPVIHGDPEAATINYLRSKVSVTSICPPSNITSNLNGYNVSPETKRWVMVTLEGGWQSKSKVFKPRIDIQCYAESRTVAYELCKTAMAEMMASFGYRGEGLFICDARSEMGPTRINDRLSENYRYVCSLRLTVVPG